jgi:hypothetical protein
MDEQTSDTLKMLTELAIIEITAEFDGGGDSGQIQAVEITESLHEAKAYDKILVPQWFADKYCNGPAEVGGYLNEWVENLVMSTDYDWYNNDGGYGEVLIRPGEKRIFVDMNIREVISNNFESELGEEPSEVTDNG